MGGKRIADSTSNKAKYSVVQHLPFLLVGCPSHCSIEKAAINEFKYQIGLKHGLNTSLPDGIVRLSFEDMDTLHDGGVNLEFGGCGKSGHCL